MKSIKFKGENLYLEVGEYFNTGRISILAYTKDDFYGDITKNLPFTFLEDEQKGGFINQYTKSDGLEQKLKEEGIIKKIVGREKYNMEAYDEVIFDLEKLKEYDMEGVNKYLENFKEEEEEFE